VLPSRGLSPHSRGKYGLTEDADLTLYLSPLDVESILGDWRIDSKKIQVSFLDETYMILRLQYLGEVPKFSSCMALQIQLQDNIRGGD
jgi:hypothetical protein